MNIPPLWGCWGTGEAGAWISLLCQVRAKVPNTHTRFSSAQWSDHFKKTGLVVLKTMLLCCLVRWPVKSDGERTVFL